VPHEGDSTVVSEVVSNPVAFQIFHTVETRMVGFKDHSVPLYYQLENILREKIKSREYGPGDSIPTEDQLVRSYAVSRITVRRALSTLKKDGLIDRRRGRGSFVTQGQRDLEPMKLTGMIEDIIAMGVKTKTKVVGFGSVRPTKKVADALRLNEEMKVLRIERIRLIKASPISHTVSYIPPDIGESIKKEDLAIHPLLNILEKKCHVKIGRGTQIIEATLADSRIASLLGVMTGAPLLKIERTVFDIKDRPIEYLSILYRSDRYHYSVDLIRKRSESRTQWDYIKK
jgi:GntR family transcriptional regulator